MSIYVITHKDYEFPDSDLYKPLVVGKAINNVDLAGHSSAVYDNTNDNISYKNKEYCELTGMYWLWKNCNDKFIGICHYRRHFSSNEKECVLKGKNIIGNNELTVLLEQYDIIVPKGMSLMKGTVFSQYSKIHYIRDLFLLRDCISKTNSDYIQSFEKVMNQSILHPFNMVITRKNIFDEYCNWLFSTLFDYESKIDISTYNNYQKRLYGFLAERLFTVWLFHNHNRFSIKEIDVVEIENIPVMKFPIKEKINIIWSNLKYFATRSISIFAFNAMK